MILPILRDDNPVLRIKSTPVTEFDNNLRQLVGSLKETAIAERGIGISAIQCGIDKQICLVSDDGVKFTVLINPKIIKKSQFRSTSVEGCLSLYGRYQVMRHNSVTIEAQNVEGEIFIFTAEGLLGFCCQHELQHLEGILVSDIGKAV